ncbi:hypothetical protein SAMN05421882_10992 [Nitrosomonas communis]|uniref:Uncharacterized protein n=1 Tax=Nitrosomonas communis TaxID=44574 RepID=A0A1H2ZYF3_9PROT|nr:hypothetical protein SAMN05421882_10992 [Nitrosomonas communis]
MSGMSTDQAVKNKSSILVPAGLLCFLENQGRSLRKITRIGTGQCFL